MKLDGWCYEVHPGLLSGRYPLPELLPELLAKGVTLFLDLTEVRELPPYELPEGIEHRRLPIRDFDVPTQETMVRILDELTGALAAGRCVYVHCHGGIGRSGTVVGCHLVEEGLSGEEALEEIRRLRLEGGCHPHSPETEAQFAMVRRWPRTRRPELKQGR
jgi:protein-tyrosine phosphatase